MDNFSTTEFTERYIVLEERKSDLAEYTKLPSLFNQSHCKRIDQKILIKRTNLNISLALKIIMGHIKNLQLQFFSSEIAFQ